MTRVLMDSKQGRLLVHRAQVTDSSQLLSHTTPQGVTEVSSMDNSSRVDMVSKEVRLQLLTCILPAYSRFDLARIFGVAHLQSQDSHIYILKKNSPQTLGGSHGRNLDIFALSSFICCLNILGC